jgi:hypothetical protein
MPGFRSPLSWDWDDDSLLPRRADYTEAEIQRMEVAAERRPVSIPCDQPMRDNREEGVS